ncbi:hypothetical protein [Cryobacterium sp. BB736]|uniref:hypothetical protein n=1 Tax=Cryobacterium sp. BB736 TaxID=2746963 RepID=UPI001874BEAD|nr:hypothetical protein [Cryobacterium sp. BB736]
MTSTTDQVDTPAPSAAATRWLTFAWGLAIGAGSALVGLLPWLITGMRLPLQNLWETTVDPEAMPIALLPFSQYSITLIVGLIVFGSAVAGLLGRTFRERLSRRGFLGIALGAFLVQIGAATQSTLVVASGLPGDSLAAIYLTGLIAVAVVSIGVGALVMVLIGRAARPGATLGFAMAAVSVEAWLSALVVPPGTFVTEASMWWLDLARYLPAIIVGVAIAWCGIRSIGGVIAAVGSLLILWIAPVALVSVSVAVGSRAIASQPDQMLDYGGEVFISVLMTAQNSIPPLVIAIVVAGIGLASRQLISSWPRRSREAE